jgi:hypothetical protein
MYFLTVDANLNLKFNGKKIPDYFAEMTCFISPRLQFSSDCKSVKVANEVSVAKDSAVSNLQNKRVPVQNVAPAKKQNEQNAGAGVAH